MKRVLVVYYSQTGQLRRTVESLCAPLQASDEVQLDWCALTPQQPYPFPWPFWSFFDQFPETIAEIPPLLQPLDIDTGTRYDLIILAYTVWFLSPAPPITAFLQSETARSLLRDTPVVTLIACRNMWHLAHERTKAMLATAGARLSDNIVLTDRGSSLATFITTPRWMLTGRRDPILGFPAAGLGDADIRATRRFGHALLAALRSDRLDGRTPALCGLGAVTADARLVASETIGRRSFTIWGRPIRAIGPQGTRARRPVLAIYVAFLVTMIVTIVPLSLLLRALLRPLSRRRHAAQKQYFEQPSGSGTEHLGTYPHE